MMDNFFISNVEHNKCDSKWMKLVTFITYSITILCDKLNKEVVILGQGSMNLYLNPKFEPLALSLDIFWVASEYYLHMVWDERYIKPSYLGQILENYAWFRCRQSPVSSVGRASDF